MKKLMLLGLSVAAIPIALQATEAQITLAPNFLMLDGTYKFNLDVEGIVTPDKIWNVIVKDGKATLQRVKKGTKGKNIEIKDNVISVKIGALKGRDAQDLEVQALDGALKEQLATMAPRKDTKKLTVDVGPGLTLQYIDLKRSKIGEDFSYRLQIGSNLPDGSYTCKLIRPPKGERGDKTFRFDVEDHKIIKVSENGKDKLGKLVDGSLEIEATKMCATRRAKIAGAIGGAATAVILGSIATGGAAWAVAGPAGVAVKISFVFPLLLNLGLTSAQASAVIIAATPIAGAATTAAVVAALPAAITATVGTAVGITADEVSKVAKAMEEGKTFGGTTIGAIFGFREMTLLITCNSGALAGKAVKIDYEECRKNIWVLDSIDNKVLITA